MILTILLHANELLQIEISSTQGRFIIHGQGGGDFYFRNRQKKCPPRKQFLKKILVLFLSKTRKKWVSRAFYKKFLPKKSGPPQKIFFEKIFQSYFCPKRAEKWVSRAFYKKKLPKKVPPLKISGHPRLVNNERSLMIVNSNLFHNVTVCMIHLSCYDNDYRL